VVSPGQPGNYLRPEKDRPLRTMSPVYSSHGALLFRNLRHLIRPANIHGSGTLTTRSAPPRPALSEDGCQLPGNARQLLTGFQYA
jgi:hypothetical protein